MSILDELAAHARERVLADSENMSLDILQAMCREKGRANGARFYDALKKGDLSFICEVKKASLSKGVIARDFPYLDIARDYEAAGADCISCLTEPKWFLGSDDIFREIRAAVSTPMLRKDFTVSDYQLYQSRLMGADCVLLICALLDTKTLAQYLAVCDELGLSALVETHDADEIRSAVAAGAKIIGPGGGPRRERSQDGSGCRRQNHWRQQPQSERFFRRLFQRRAAARPHPAGSGLRGRVRRAERAGRRRTPLDRCRRGTDRRNTDEGT